MLEGIDEIDVVPTRWLHLTVQGVGSVDDVAEEDVAALVGSAQQRLAELQPVKLILEPAEVQWEGVTLTATPAEAVAAVRSALRTAIAANRLTDGHGLASRIVFRQATDQELAARQSALHSAAGELLDELDRSGIFAERGPLRVTGSYISELMCWRDLDLGLLVGADYSPQDVVGLLSRIVDLPGVVGFDYRDERGDRSPTGFRKEERYHVPFLLARGDGQWRADLTLWLHDPHENVTAWHRALRDSITDEQRAAVLRIKDVWHRLSSYPDEVGGFEIYTAVLEDKVRTAEQFRGWLADRGLPQT